MHLEALGCLQQFLDSYGLLTGALGRGFRLSMARTTDEVLWMRGSVWFCSWPVGFQFFAFEASVAVAALRLWSLKTSVALSHLWPLLFSSLCPS
jgi:hypothetical protein